jgi:hypothetical protein
MFGSPTSQKSTATATASTAHANLTAIHHANFLSSTPRPDDIVAAAAAAGISNMTFSEHLTVRSGPSLLRYLHRHLCLLAAQMERILLLANVDRRPMPQQPELGRAYLLWR